VPVYRQLQYLSFGPQNCTPKILAGLGIPQFTGKKTIRVSYSHHAPEYAAAILQLGSHSTLARRRCLCLCRLLPPSTSWGSLLLHIVGGAITITGAGGGSTGVVTSFFCLLVLTDDMVGGGVILGVRFFYGGRPFQNARLTKKIERTIP
jgi:hypothetical protein